LQDFEQRRLLGCGTYGRVHQIRCKYTQQEFAVKVLKKSVVLKLKQVEHLKNEKAVLVKADHPFIVKLYRTYTDRHNIYFLMELCAGGELFGLMRTTGNLQKSVAQFYAAEIVLVLEYLHSIGVAYRDLKPENVLLDESGHIKMCDFGFAKFVSDRTWTLCGTTEYLAPEVITGGGHDMAVDWWALGVLLYEMLAGYPPFYGTNPIEIFEKICDGVVTFPPHFDEETKDLISKFLTQSKSRRLGNGLDGARAVKSHPFFSNINWEALLNREVLVPVSLEALSRAQQFMIEGLQEAEPEYNLVQSEDNGSADNKDEYENLFSTFE